MAVILIFLCPFQGSAQLDSIDSVEVKVKKKWEIRGFGANWNPGPTQFFEGYNRDLMYANASAGLPLLPQWEAFTDAAVASEHFQAGVRGYIVDTAETFRLRVSLSFARRDDSLFYQGSLSANDTVEVRAGKERSNFLVFGFSTIKATRKLGGFLRLYAGAELELGVSRRSRMNFWQYRYDISEGGIVDEINYFPAAGSPKFTALAFAQLGTEICLAKYFALNFELRSGIGAHLVMRTAPVGLSKTQLSMGLNVYPWGN